MEFLDNSKLHAIAVSYFFDRQSLVACNVGEHHFQIACNSSFALVSVADCSEYPEVECFSRVIR